MKKTNTRITVEFRDPLVRPGMTVKIEVSKKYFIPETEDMLNLIRELNKRQSDSSS